MTFQKLLPCLLLRPYSFAYLVISTDLLVYLISLWAALAHRFIDPPALLFLQVYKLSLRSRKLTDLISNNFCLLSFFVIVIVIIVIVMVCHHLERWYFALVAINPPAIAHHRCGFSRGWRDKIALRGRTWPRIPPLDILVNDFLLANWKVRVYHMHRLLQLNHLRVHGLCLLYSFVLIVVILALLN